MEGMLLGCLAHQTGINGVVDGLHLDFSDPKTVFSNTSRTTNCNSGDALNAIQDLSPKQNHTTGVSTTNGGSIKYLQWQNNVINGKPAYILATAGGTPYHTFTNPSLFSSYTSTGFTLAVVYSLSSITQSMHFYTFWDSLAPNNRMCWLLFGGSSGSTNEQLMNVSRPTFNGALGTVATSPNRSNYIWIVTGSPALGVGYYVNGVKINTTTAFTTNGLSYQYAIGRNKDSSGTTSNLFNGAVGEMRLYSGGRSAVDVQDLYLELKAKWKF